MFAAAGGNPLCHAQQTVATFGGEPGPAPDDAPTAPDSTCMRTVCFGGRATAKGLVKLVQMQIGLDDYPDASFVAPWRPVEDFTDHLTGAARDDLYVYFADNRTQLIYRKAINAAPADPATSLPNPFVPADPGFNLGAVMMWNGRFYWTDYNSDTADIYSINPDGTSSYYEGGFASSGKVVKLVGYTYRATALTFRDALFALTADRQLIRMDRNPSAPRVVLATGITDFAIRDEFQVVPPSSSPVSRPSMPRRGRRTSGRQHPARHVVGHQRRRRHYQHNLYGHGNKPTATDVGRRGDATNVYWSEQPISFNGTFGYSLGNYSMYRQLRPATTPNRPAAWTSSTLAPTRA